MFPSCYKMRENLDVCFCFSRCPAERLICPSKTREIKEKNKRFHRLKFFSFSFCRYSCCFPKSLPSLPGRAGQGIDGLVSSRKSKSSPGTFPNYCKWPRHAKSKPSLRRFPVAAVFLIASHLQRATACLRRLLGFY